MENNEMVIVTLQDIKPIPEKDKIVKANVCLNDIPLTQVIVSIDTKENTLIGYCDSNLALSDKLVTDYPELGKYLGKGNRVKAIKFKDTYSNGLCIELEKLYKYFDSEEEAKKVLVHGYSFTKINDIEICKKYIPVIKLADNSSNQNKNKPKEKSVSRMIPGQFNLHIKTNQLLRNVHVLDPNAVISISYKFHGTSGVVSNCLVKRKLNWKDKIAKYFKIPIIETEYDYIYSSREVVRNGKFTKYQIDTSIYKQACDELRGKLNQGETAYFEIVGYTDNNKCIQKNYDYGCEPNKHKIVIYRITYTSTEGKVFEYSWAAMKERCAEIGIEPVREFYFGKAKDLFPDILVDENWTKNFIERLKVTYLNRDCDICKNKVPNEGIVIRIESKEIKSFKLKSDAFCANQSKLADQGEIDIEDIN